MDVKKTRKTLIINKIEKKEVYYHGTDKIFNEFSVPETSKNIKSPLGLLGIYFTKCPKLASDFSKVSWSNPRSTYRKKANVRPVYLRLNNPKVLDIDTFLMLSGRGDKYLREFKQDLIKDGFDSIIFEKPSDKSKYPNFIIDEFPTNQYIAFYNYQISSIFEEKI